MEPKKIMKELSELLDQVDVSYNRIAKEHGLTYNALLLFYTVDETDHLTQKQACDALYLPKSSVHHLVSGFVDKGLMALTPGSNKKEKYIVFTPAGRAFMDQINADTDQIEAAALTAVREEDVAQFVKTARALAALFTAETDRLYGKK